MSFPLQFLLSPYPPAEESAPNHGCQSPSPASQDGEEGKEGLSSQRGRFPPGMLR